MTRSSIRTEKLSKEFNGVTILEDISIKFPENGVFGVLGKNGAGKTTFLAMLMGLITPTKGDIFIFNKSLKLKKYEILEKINFQSPYIDLPKKMTVIQNLVFYSRLYNIQNYEARINTLSLDLSIKELFKKNYGTLSSGQKTRVNLCKALLNKPKLLLLDEPTSSLDVTTSDFVREYILDFQKQNNSTILLTSHDLVEIEKMCSYLVILKNGRVSYKGELKDLIKKNNYSSLKDIFIKDDQ